LSLRNTARAFPTLLRVGFADAVAYRAEMLIWVLATTMPLVMLALWSTVARDAPVGRYGEAEFTAYFLVTFIVRQITGSWVFYDINFAIRNGTLAMRLLRPVHPLWAYAAEALASMPMRLLVSVPVAVVALAAVGWKALAHDPVLWAVWLASIAGAWLITLLVNLIVGCVAFFLESSLKVMDAWLVAFFVFSGYLIPIDLFPARLRAVVDVLPFRFQIGFPVEVVTGAHDRASALALLGGQWAWVVVMLTATALLWRGGLRRFAAYGG
jgi:ABC-2 type transport system permease protein